MFYLINSETKLPWNDNDGEPMTFATGAEAAVVAKQYSEWYNIKLRPQPAPKGDMSWKEREAQRIADGTYKRPDYLNRLEQKPEHFLHLAEKRPGQLSYTKNDVKGGADQQTIITFQGYVETFCYNKIPEVEIEALREEHDANDTSEDNLKFATTPEEITEVYTNYDDECSQVAGSCMKYNADEINEDGGEAPPVHPTSIYGAGDLAVAYTTNDEGRTTARALCWPEKKVYSRVYSDDGDLLHRLLRKRGFKKSKGYYSRADKHISEHSLEGARMLRIQHTEDGSVFVVPYCDDCENAKDDGKFLIIAQSGRINMRRTDGWSCEVDKDYLYCGRCEDRCDEDFMYNVYIGRRSTELWCEACQGDYSFYCNHSGDYYCDSNVEQIDVEGSTWSVYAARDYAMQCQRTGAWVSNDNAIDVVIDDGGGIEMWCQAAIDEHAWCCDKSGDYVSNKVEAVYVEGRYGPEDWAPHTANYAAFKSEVDELLYPIEQLVFISGARMVTRAQEAAARAGTVALVPYKVDAKRLWLKCDHPDQLKIDLTTPSPEPLDNRGRLIPRDQYGRFIGRGEINPLTNRTYIFTDAVNRQRAINYITQSR